jgi:hypothetical protein
MCSLSASGRSGIDGVQAYLSVARGVEVDLCGETIKASKYAFGACVEQEVLEVNRVDRHGVYVRKHGS